MNAPLKRKSLYRPVLIVAIVLLTAFTFYNIINRMT
jgi:hypothetical protein